MTNTQPMRPDLYISGDVETDGPIPGRFSMLSFGLTVVGRFDGNTFRRFKNGELSLYRELQPISDHYETEALEVNGLDRVRLQREGSSPTTAMNDAWQWVMDVSTDCRPVLVAYPASFDWTWLYWYFIQFGDHGSPFGFSSCFDIKTMLATIARVPLDRATKKHIDCGVNALAHTHHALEDAIEQGDLFAKLFELNLSNPTRAPLEVSRSRRP